METGAGRGGPGGLRHRRAVRTAEGKVRRPWVFRIVLSYSRKAYSEAVWRQTTERSSAAWRTPFVISAACPSDLVIDNLKAAVARADWYDPEIHPKLQSFARHYGTVFLPTKPYTPRHKVSELKTSWEIGSLNGSCRVSLPPGGKGEIEVPLPQNLTPGSLLVLRFFDPQGGLVNAHGITVGTAPSPPLPKPRAGCPSWKDDGKIITIQADDFQIRLVRRSGRMLPDPAGRSVPLLGLPMPFLTRQETRNPFNPGGLPYAQYPDEASRTIDDLSVEQRGPALAITLSDHFDNLRGSLKILLDKAGVASVSFDYVYSGEPLLRSEVGLRFLFDKRCAEIGWRRNAHWDVYPPDHIGRPEGRAHARTSQAETKVSFPPFRSRPGWPWHLDQNEFGTRDFRAAKYSIYQAELVGPDGSGIRVYSDGSTDVRANLAPDGVQFHLLLGREASPPRNVATGDRLAGSFAIQLLPASNRN